ncbi:MAG: glycoside hydrolase family 57 protein [Deltaproteobacteria bacterium]|nr:glycoside hydrolase family 57 protein [Deltaproteobacteria bacterium]
MPSVCLYFQVHQPFRVRKFAYADSCSQLNYFDDLKNKTVCQKVAQKCYLPTNALMLELIKRFAGQFKVAYSISGLAIEQFRLYCPEVINSFRELASTGYVEFIAETYYHSLSSLYDEQEFIAQIDKQVGLMEELFGQRPRTFRNTELIYDDRIGNIVAGLGFRAMITEGADSILQGRSPNYTYRHPNNNMRLLLKNYGYSDDIAFRFSNRAWQHYPLSAEKFASWLHSSNANDQCINLFMDYETFGEHQWDVTGIFDFLNQFPQSILANQQWNFATPDELICWYPGQETISFPHTVSWADLDRDLSAWQGNRMQNKALDNIYALGQHIKATQNDHLLDVWRKLQTSDHFYYMSTKSLSDGAVHAYFSPYESPYDAFIYYMNLLHDFAQQCQRYPTQTSCSTNQLVIEKEYITELNSEEPIPSSNYERFSVNETITEIPLPGNK